MQNLKSLIKKSLNGIGFEIKRVMPPDKVDEERINFKMPWLMQSNINTVIDVGANSGQFARNIHKALGGATIVSFEPLTATYEQLVEKTKHLPSFTAVKCALGAQTTQMEIHSNFYSPSSSLLEMTELHKLNFPHTSQETLEIISVKRLDDVLDEMALKDDILLKIDVQGYENQVLLGAGKILSRVKLIFIEVSFRMLYAQQPLFDDIYSNLKSKGFEYVGNIDQLQSPIDGRVLQADAIFERSS